MAAIVKFSCPSCGVILKNTNPQMAGKTIKCPKCSKPVLVPGNTKAIASIRHLPGPSMGTSVPILPQPAAAPALKPLDPNAQPVKIGAKDGSPPPEPLAFAGEKPRKPEAPEPPPAP